MVEKLKLAIDQITWAKIYSRISHWEKNPAARKDASIQAYCHDNDGSTSTACYFNATMIMEVGPYTGPYPQLENTINLFGRTIDLQDNPLQIAVHDSASGAQFHQTGDAGFGTQYFSTGDKLVTGSYINSNSSCQPSGTYVWGFSFLMLFTFCVLTIIFTFVLSCVYADTYWNSKADLYEHPASIYRDILDLAREIKHILGEDGDNLSTKELNQKIERNTTSVQLETDALLPSRSEAIRRRWKEATVRQQSVEKQSVVAIVRKEERV